MSLLVIEFTFLEGRYGELVVKELADFYSKCNMVSSYVFKRPYSWEEVPSFNVKMNQAVDNVCNWNDGGALYSNLETVLHGEASSVVAMYCFGSQKTQFVSCHIDSTVIDVTQLGCPPLADISLPASAARFHVTSSYMFVHCGRPIH